ncbi:putative cell wall protein [Lycium barbarum]|uniref:putative cell wall protein n=1 Tax=Lycium barbarum TaxID=112863 RepID=UPI00293EC6AC|nr:putative cell wall protein [Lycium barbarum]
MANIIHSIISFLFTLAIFLSFSWYALAGRDIPNTNPKISDKKLQPNSFLPPYDGTVLIPGFGRVVVPPKGSHVNPFTYNPITGTNNGNGLVIPDPGSGSGIGNIPGGDDTLVPNPGVEVPTGGTIPTPP